MALKIAFQMDPIEAVNINGDSTFRLAEEAQARGHALFFYTPDRLAWQEGRVTARGRPFSVKRLQGDHVAFGDEAEIDLATQDVVWLRQDPPFDMAYITTTHLLEHLQATTLVVNDPASVRNAPEKLLVLNFPDLTPPTTIARDIHAIRAFREKHGHIILKPLYGNGGAGVFLIEETSSNLVSLIELFEQAFREPFMVQRYLPEVRKGDKRIILVDGEPVGAVNRVPSEGEARSNMHVGGRPELSELTAREREICAAIGPKLRELDMVFVGIDVIGDYLTEINVTSPTGIREIKRFGGPDIAPMIWNAIEKRRA